MAVSVDSKVAFPLKWKIIGTNVTLLLLTIFLLVGFASNLFNEDKTATIYETTLESSLALAERFNVFFKNNHSTFELLRSFSENAEAGVAQEKLFKNVFAKNEHTVGFASWRHSGKKNKQLQVYLENDLYLATHKIAPKAILKQFEAENLPMKEKVKVSYLNSGESSPLWQISFRNKDHSFMALFSMEQPLKDLSASSQYLNFIAIGNKVLTTQARDNGELENIISQKLSSFSKESAQVTNLSLVGGNYLAGLAPAQNDALAISLINDSIIFQASRFLREQSLYFSLFIFAMTVFMGVLISRRMTSDLSKLHDASLAFSRGDFNKGLEVKSRDEIGSLATTFKKMGQDILRYIEEMKDKARLENEMEVARLVQESFIPQKEMSFHHIKLSSFYKPTSECSGDWWGSFKCGEELVIVVADATGHGVPAALLTATASGCLHQLEYDVEKGRRTNLKASEILEVFNYAIHKMGGKVHMTAFAIVIDSQTGEATYSNASHNPPLLIKAGLNDNRGDLEKDALMPLMGAQGARLGQEAQSRYEDVSLSLDKGDFLFLYSDGLVEQENPEGKQWGNRRFYKEILGHLNQHKSTDSLTGLSRHLLEELKSFSGTSQWDDDITLLSVGFFEGELSQTSSSRYQFIVEDKAFICSEDNDAIYSEYLSQFPFSMVARDKTELEKLQTIKKNLAENELGMALISETILKEIVLSISSTSEVEDQIDQALEQFDYSGYFDTPKNPFALLVRELSSNALYHQNEATSNEDRTGEFKTDKDSTIELVLTQTNDGLGVRVTDNSGRLHYDEFRRALMRAFKEKSPENKQGGAGLGLYMVFQNSNQVFIDVTKGKRTQVLAVIEKERRYKNFRSKTTQMIFNER